jgi:hypothetical protein
MDQRSWAMAAVNCLEPIYCGATWEINRPIFMREELILSVNFSQKLQTVEFVIVRVKG